jgi:uncharacterized membrane protein
MRSRFSIAGHPLHPTLVAVPVGLFVWTFVGDIVYLVTGKEHMWYSLAFWTGIAAMIAALVAALPGFGDYFTTAIHTDARGIATTHMALNLATLVLFFVAFLLMLDNGATAGGRLTAVFILHLVGVGLLALSGWLGGEMVYRHHLSMIPDDARLAEAEQAHHELHPQMNPRP